METPSIPDAGDTESRNEGAEFSGNLPQVTHLQFLVLDVLLRQSEGTSATTLRTELKQHGQGREGPKFYQMMRRLAQTGMIESWSEHFDVGGGEVERTFYRATDIGRMAWRLTVEFYAVRVRAMETLCDPGNRESHGKQ